jgi:hypothetical protein
MKIRVKFGLNPYDNSFICGRCREPFERGGLFVRLEHGGNVVDIPVCSRCVESGGLFEGVIDLSAHSASHPIGLA